MKKYLSLFLVLSLYAKAIGQSNPINFEQNYSANVNNELWNNAFYGSTTQLSVAFGDLDGDSDFDLVQGSRYRVEWIKNIGSETKFELEDLNFGNIMNNSNAFWSPSLVDIDNDNDLDLFCGKLEGDISFWKNSGNHSNPNFSNEVSNYSNIKVNMHAHVSFCDIDNDNDFDLFIGDGDGVIHFYKNVGSSQIPDFEEQPSSLIDKIEGNTVSPEFVDIDADGDMDLFIGTSLGKIYYYENIGTPNDYSFNLVTKNYANINIGWSDLKVTFIDIDNDDDKDMFITDLRGYFYFYKNIGDNANPVWNLVTSCFNRILNFGRSSGPASGDIDDDGDNDIVFGDGTIVENVGTPSEPAWHIDDQLPNNPDYIFDMPTLIDIDGDNDLDLFYGSNMGYLVYYENKGNPSNPNWALISSNYENINYGTNTHVSISFADIDGDLDYDMFVEHCNWNNPIYPSGYDLISYYENVGNPNQPQWNLIEENYLNLGAHRIGFGRCSFGDIDHDGDIDCLCGNSHPGIFYLYENDGDSNRPVWNFVGEFNNGIRVEGNRSYATPILVDLNNDSYPEILSGNDGGGLNFWWNESANTIDGGEFTFVQNAQPFIKPVISTNSKSYFYYYINENDKTPPAGSSFEFGLETNNSTIPAGGKYLGDGILQFWLSLDENINQPNLQISIPGTVSYNGTEIGFNNTPANFNTQVQGNPVNQGIDILAGGSLGVKLIAGGAGAGPSVAAASLSLNGTGGMGINFHRDAEGNEFITRRFEAGVGLSVETPAINAVVGDIQAGASGSVMVKGVMGQTMYFPNNLYSELSQKAKAAYILETFTMGGIELSPFASIFLKALKSSLASTNPDLNAIYSDLYYSNQTGSSLEGEASIGFSVASGEDAEQTKLDIIEFGGYVALTKQNIEHYHNSDKSFRFGYASGFDISALNFEVANVDFGNVYDFKFGTDFSVGANYNPNEGIKSFELSFGATPSAQISFASFSTSYNYDFLIPKSIITKNQNANNIIGTVAPIFIPGLPKKHFKVGMNYFTENLDDIYADNPGQLNSFNDHIVMQKTKSSTKGLDVDAKIGLDAALGVGAGLKLGIHFSYLDEMYYPKSQYVVANSHILPIAEYNDIPDEQRLFSIQNEIYDVFQGTVLLVKEQLNNLLNVIETGIESGKKFTISMLNGAAMLTGELVGNELKWITRTSNPATKSVQKSAFLEPEVIKAYSSRRIIHIQNKSANLSDEEEESVLYIVSENINVSLVNSGNEIINEFEPVTLSIAIDNEKMSELGFGDPEKQLAKMYQYDAENLVWNELEGDLNDHMDTVSTQITNSASYAIGIELNSNNDNAAPVIQEYYPKNGEKIERVTNFWAKLYESPTGVGIDFSQTIIKIDDIEVAAVWFPLENIISFESVDSLSFGQHTFEVVAKDYNGNTNTIKSTVFVSYPTGISSHDNIMQFNCYPVPMNEILNIEIMSKTNAPVFVSIYNQLGQLITNSFKCQPVNGYIKIQWDRTGMNLERMKSGIYFVRVKQNKNIMVKKILLE